MKEFSFLFLKVSCAVESCPIVLCHVLFPTFLDPRRRIQEEDDSNLQGVWFLLWLFYREKSKFVCLIIQGRRTQLWRPVLERTTSAFHCVVDRWQRSLQWEGFFVFISCQLIFFQNTGFVAENKVEGKTLMIHRSVLKTLSSSATKGVLQIHKTPLAAGLQRSCSSGENIFGLNSIWHSWKLSPLTRRDQKAQQRQTRSIVSSVIQSRKADFLYSSTRVYPGKEQEFSHSSEHHPRSLPPTVSRSMCTETTKVLYFRN